MATKTWQNQVASGEADLAIEQFFVMAYSSGSPGNGWINTPTMVTDVDTPPTGFTSLGAVVEDSVTVTGEREKFQLMTGIPSILQYEAVISMTARLEFSLHAISNSKVQYALGINTPRSVGSAGTGVAYGTTLLPYYTILGVAHFLNGAQVIHYFEKCSPVGAWTEEIRGEENPRQPLAFDVTAYESTNYAGGTSEWVLFERFYWSA